jgi:aryl-alcohol dehydrogenase-like predicted oxidoreductase
VEFRKLLETYKFGLVAWSSLAGGILTGKYINGIPENELNRFTDTNYFSKEVMRTFYYDPYQN